MFVFYLEIQQAKVLHNSNNRFHLFPAFDYDKNWTQFF